MDDELIEKISYDIVKILESSDIKEISQEDVLQYINVEISSIKEYQSIKIMDADSNYGEENGIYIVLTPSPVMLIVVNSVQKRINITQDNAVMLLTLTYSVRFMSLLKKDVREDIIKLTTEINNIIDKIKTEC